MKLLLPLILLPSILLARPPRCAVVAPWDDATPLYSLQSALQDTADFPADQVSSAGNFRVHYHTTGEDAATSAFVDSVCAVAEQVWQVESGQQDYQEAPRWADGRYHIYLQNLTSLFGYTLLTEAVNYDDPDGPWYSRIILDNDYPEEVFELPPQQALQVTLAHEYFHAIQVGLFDCTGQQWFMELTATWMEDQVYGQIDDWLRYLPAYLNTLDQSMRIMNGEREYGMALWAHYLNQRFGAGLLLDAWYQGAVTRSDMMTICQELAQELAPENSWELFSQFHVWNMMTGERALPGFGYPEAQAYPLAPVQLFTGSGLFETEELALTALAVAEPIYAALSIEAGVSWRLNRRTGVNSSFCCGQTDTTGFDIDQLVLHVAQAGAGSSAMYLNLTELQPLEEGRIALLKAYPNPAVSDIRLNLYALEPLATELHLYDILGRRLLTLPVSGAGEFSFILPLSGYPSGIYVIELDGAYQRIMHLR
ncbi:MAG: T9SS type A sorting domain-containing protein [Candidatus Delongbacteria bacterium]|nr:T9SS type A sorting domain-containing protein [Candidatus Delongbacteria bacterium]